MPQHLTEIILFIKNRLEDKNFRLDRQKLKSNESRRSSEKPNRKWIKTFRIGVECDAFQGARLSLSLSLSLSEVLDTR